MANLAHALRGIHRGRRRGDLNAVAQIGVLRHWLAAKSRWGRRAAGSEVRRHLAWVRGASPFYRAQRSAALEDWPVVDRRQLMAAFEAWNTAGITLAMARAKFPLPAGIEAGLSSGTAGERGVFLTSPRERAEWAGTMLARVLPRAPWRSQRVALCLRDSNALYFAASGRGVQLAHFALDAVAEAKAFRPDIIVAPPRILAEFAQHDVAAERVIAVAETLDEPEETRLAARYPGRVHQVYQATEGFLAATCEHGTLHLNEDFLVVEKEWIDRGSGRFRPVVTDLRRRTQPVVRLRIDDVLIERETPCPCGCVFTSLERVEGRLEDVFQLAGGRQVFPRELRACFANRLPGVDYRIRQISPDCAEVAVADGVANPPLLAELARWIPRIRVVPFPSPDPIEKKLRRVTRAPFD